MSSTIPVSHARVSLALRLTIWFTGSSFLLIFAATGFLYWSLATNLDREDDEFLADQALILRGLLRERPDDAAGIRQEVEFESSVRRHARMYVRIMNENQGTVVETPGMPPGLGPREFPPPSGPDEEPAGGSVVRAADGRVFRVLAAKSLVGPGGSEARVLQIALDRREEEELLADFRRHILPVLGIALFLSALFGYRIARRGVRPVEQIAAAARRIRSSTLHERIVSSDFPAELLDLAITFNEMLDRLKDSFERLARFSADIAHELRTPLSNLQGEFEVALNRARSPHEYREILSSGLEEIARLSRLTESLRFLARTEDPRGWIHREHLDAGSELRAVREFYDAAASEAGVALDVEARVPLPAELDRTLFHRALGNLVENALAHTPRGGSVALSGQRDDGALEVSVSDTGPGIPPEHVSRVFDRFYRVDPSRNAATGGMGLGLAIAKSIAELHGGSVRLESAMGRGTHVTLRFPCSDDENVIQT